MGKIVIIGSGFSGLSAACFAAKEGHEVTVLEKNPTTGGRCRAYSENGFMFDMGPSWYWMPDIFENFFASFGKKPSDYYDLVKLDPGFRIYFGKGDMLDVPAGMDELYATFEVIEKGSSQKLRKFMKEGKVKYEVGMKHLVYKPALSWMEFARFDVLKGVAQTNIFRSVRSYVRSYFKDPRLVALMEFPVLFLGAMPQNIPALYTLMNYAALDMGTWYPMGGMRKIIDGMESLAKELGVKIHTGAAVDRIHVNEGKATEVSTSNGVFTADAVISSADYHHTEQKLLSPEYRNYNEEYWEKKTFAPSSLLFYVGVKKKIKNLIHHNLFFDADLDVHAKDIYSIPAWPKNPLFYVCAPSVTDSSVAPEGMENLFILIPLAPGLKDTEEMRESYFEGIIRRMEHICGDDILEHVIYKKSYCVNDFVRDYNAYKGNAYGLANTLRQTAVLKPSLRNKKVDNLFYTGQLTVPGPGIPPSIISGQIAVEQANKQLHKQMTHERTV